MHDTLAKTQPVFCECKVSHFFPFEKIILHFFSVSHDFMGFKPLLSDKKSCCSNCHEKQFEYFCAIKTTLTMGKTQGIVLRTVKYGDNSMIVDLYTNTRGRASFVTRVIRSRRSGVSSALWAPMTWIEFEAPESRGGKLPSIKQPLIIHPYSTLNFRPDKAAIVIFLSEFLSHALKEEEPSEPLFRFLTESLQWLDRAKADYANFHLMFSVRLTTFLGIQPNLEAFSPDSVFNLADSTYETFPPLHGTYLPPEEARWLPTLFRLNYRTMRLLKLRRPQKTRFMKIINDYYRIHVPSFPTLQSPDILREIFA